MRLRIKAKAFGLSILLITSAILPTACSQDDEKSARTERYPEIEQLIEAVQSVDSALARGFLLRSATPRVQNEFQENLYRIRAAAYLLRADPRDADALGQLHQSFKTYETLNLIQDDRTLLEGFIDKLRQTLDMLSSMQGASLDGFGTERLRTLFAHNFNLANDLGDFRTYTPAQNKAQSWKVTSCGIRCGNLEYLIAQVEKPGDETWLLSPRLALADRDGMTLKIEGSARGPLVDVQGDGADRRFHILVSEVYTGGNVQESDQWQDVTDLLINFPGGKYAAQFRSFGIELDLSRFRGKTVSVALRLSAKPSQIVPDRPETQWQVNKFTVTGKGDFSLAQLTSPVPARPDTSVRQPTTPPPPTTAPAPASPANAACASGTDLQFAYKPSIEAFGTSQGELAFVNVLADKDPKYVKFSGRLKIDGQMLNKTGQAWLVSNAIEAKGFSKLCLSFDSGLWFGDVTKTQAEVLISTDYAGDTSTATWKSVPLPTNFIMSDRVPGVAQLVRVSQLPLSALLDGKETFTLAFRYTSDEATAPWWGIKEVAVSGQKLAP